MSKRSVLSGVCIAAIMALIPATAASANSVRLSVHAAGSGGDGTISRAAAKAQREGYLVPNDAAYARQKAAAAAAAPRKSPCVRRSRAAGADRRPQLQRHPPAELRAVGLDRRRRPDPLHRARQHELRDLRQDQQHPDEHGQAEHSSPTSPNDLFDPQVIWDPGTKRFYYAMDDVASATDNRLAFGFSKTASPSTGGPPTGASTSSTTGRRSRTTRSSATRRTSSPSASTTSTAAAPSSAPTSPGSRSPARAPPARRRRRSTPAPSSACRPRRRAAFTPVGVNQTDTSAHRLRRRREHEPVDQDHLFKVTKNASGDAVIPNPGTQVTVPSYSAPPNIPQQGTTNQLDSLDRRLTQAVSGIDPGHSNKVGIWTQHTVSGGAGAEVRWYEIDPVAKDAAAVRQGDERLAVQLQRRDLAQPGGQRDA